MTLSNIGPITMDEEYREEIENFHLLIGADVGQGHGMRPVVAPEDKSKGQPFDKQGQDAHLSLIHI